MLHARYFRLRWAALGNLSRDDRGAAAVLFAVVLLPLMLTIGAAVDYTRLQQAKAKLDDAADAGALAAAIVAKQQVAAGAAGWRKAAVKAGADTFQAQVGSSAVIVSVAPTVNVTKKGGSMTATLTYSASVSTSLMQIAGFHTMAVNKAATATVGVGANFYNIALALDVSPSMAIAATSADIATLQAATPAPGCAFACHDADPAGSTSFYDIARAKGVTLRIDILKTAAQALTATVAKTAGGSGHFTMGVYGLSHGLKTFLTPTASMPTVSTAISGVDFDTMSNIVYTLPAPAPANLASGDVPLHYADTDFAASLPALAAAIPTSGAGASAASPKQIVILVTDGVNDIAVPDNTAISATYSYPPAPSFSSGNNAGKLISPIDPALCQPLKDKGAIVAVLETSYTPMPTDPNGFYQWLVQTNAPPAAVTANLKACASSPDLYYQATDQAGMTAGLAQLFNAAAQTSAVRLTN